MKHNYKNQGSLRGWIILLSVIWMLASCATYKCYPSKKSRDYSIEQTNEYKLRFSCDAPFIDNNSIQPKNTKS